MLQIRSSRSLLAILAASSLGIGSIVYLMYLPEEAIARHSAIVLAAAGGVYVGFVSDDKLNSSILETLSALFFGVLAIVGVTFYPLVLRIGFLLHAVWDYLHHCQAIDTKVSLWYPPFCAVYDCFVGVFLLVVYLK